MSETQCTYSVLQIYLGRGCPGLFIPKLLCQGIELETTWHHYQRNDRAAYFSKIRAAMTWMTRLSLKLFLELSIFIEAGRV